MRTRLLVLVDVNWFSRPLGQMTSSRGSERAPENYLRLCSPSWIPAPRSHTGNWATLTETQLNAYPHARCERGLWCTPGRLATRMRPDLVAGASMGLATVPESEKQNRASVAPGPTTRSTGLQLVAVVLTLVHRQEDRAAAMKPGRSPSASAVGATGPISSWP